MKVKLRLIQSCLVCALVALSGGCESGDGYTYNGESNYQEAVVDVGTYTVKGPVGAGWQVQVDKNAKDVVFTRVKTSPSGEEVSKSIIHVFETGIPQAAWNLSEEQLASEALKAGEQGLKRNVATVPGFSLESVEKSTVSISGKKLYVMNFKHKREPSQFFPVRVAHSAEGRFYVYFPQENAISRHRFISFNFLEGYETGSPVPLDLERANSVIDSLQLK
ncbi:MAG: hypothetical protein ABSB25_01360 [Sedimentisphaerales bacterium]